MSSNCVVRELSLLVTFLQVSSDQLELELELQARDKEVSCD